MSRTAWAKIAAAKVNRCRCGAAAAPQKIVIGQDLCLRCAIELAVPRQPNLEHQPRWGRRVA